MKPRITRGAGRVRTAALAALALAAATLLASCAPLVLGGAMVGSANTANVASICTDVMSARSGMSGSARPGGTVIAV